MASTSTANISDTSAQLHATNIHKETFSKTISNSTPTCNEIESQEKKTDKKINKTDKKKIVKKRGKESYSVYTYKVLRHHRPELAISGKSMKIMDSFLHDIFDRLANEASKLASLNEKCTIGSREIQTAVRLLLPGDLGKHAVAEGTKAIAMYTDSK